MYSYLTQVIFNISISPIGGTLTSNTTLNHRGPGNNGNEWVHSQDLQNWGLTIRCRLVSYLGQPFFLHVIKSVYFEPCKKRGQN